MVYVACHPVTRVAHTRIIERHGAACRERRHQVGARLWLWELLPGTRYHDRPTVAERQRASLETR